MMNLYKLRHGFVSVERLWYTVFAEPVTQKEGNGMKRKGFFAYRVSSPAEWIRIYAIYRSAFPRCERKPFSMIVSMWRRGKTDVWYCGRNGRFAGFATTINEESLILLDYLAVRKKGRGQGIGTEMLNALKQAYAGRGLFVEIESPFEDGRNLQERRRRKRFYEINGMRPAGVMAEVFGVKMELLCWNCRVDFKRYQNFYRDNYSPWAAKHIIEAEYPNMENRAP